MRVNQGTTENMVRDSAACDAGKMISSRGWKEKRY